MKLFNNKFYNYKFYDSKLYNSKLYNYKSNDKLYNNNLYDNRLHNNKLINTKFHNNKLNNNKLYSNNLYNNKFYNKKIVCITGSIASGKDTASDYIKKYFDLYIDVDKIAKYIFYNNIFKIKEIFNTENREVISKIAFSDKNKMNELEKIIHPKLRYLIISIISNVNKKDFIKSVLINCAIIFKLKLELFCTHIIGIVSSKDIRLERLIKYRGFSKNKATNAIKMQTDIEKFNKKIDYFVYNNTDKKNLFSYLDDIIEQIYD